MHNLKKILAGALIGVSLVASVPVRAQKIDEQLRSYFTQHLTEKLYVHLDRTAYLPGETMWCKLYVTDGTYHRPLDMSTIAYVEVLDADQQPVVQGKIALANGVGQGSFGLPATVASGRYVVRAYTNWMKNAGADHFFTAPIDIINTQATQTLAIVAPTGTEAYEVQFFPEGGNLLQGVPGRVAFKVTDRTGRGVAAQGKVLDQSGSTVTTFATRRFGLGTFELTPAAGGSTYTAILQIDKTTTLKKTLPLVQQQGYALRLDEQDKQLQVTVQTTPGSLPPVTLLVHARQQPPVLHTATVREGKVVFSVPTQTLAAGISHFTVFDQDNRPVAERLYFKAPPRQLAVTVKTEAPAYAPRQKVALTLHTSDQLAQPKAANTSLAVYQLDSLTTGPAAVALDKYLWLTSDLQGYIEHPEYYFSGDADVATTANDLMLTQGWSRFTWAEVQQPRNPAYAPELNGHIVQGKVLARGTNAPTGRIGVFLASPGRANRFYNAVSSEDGTIRFELKEYYGAHELIVQPNNERDSACYVTLSNPFSVEYQTTHAATLTLADLREKQLTQRHLQTQLLSTFLSQKPAVYRLPVVDSTTFYGKPDHRFFLDDYTRFKTMEEIMREYVTGVTVRNRKGKFYFLLYDKVNNNLFNGNPMVLLDGVPVFDLNTVMNMDPLKIKRVDVVTTRYFHGPLVYDGIVSYATYKGDLQGLPLDARALLQTYDGLQYPREFYSPRYETAQEKQSRLPDFRNLLYWNPEVITGPNGRQQVEFYTSDQPGTYRVVVQGISAEGLAGSTSYTFEVKKPL